MGSFLSNTAQIWWPSRTCKNIPTSNTVPRAVLLHPLPSSVTFLIWLQSLYLKLHPHPHFSILLIFLYFSNLSPNILHNVLTTHTVYSLTPIPMKMKFPKTKMFFFHWCITGWKTAGIWEVFKNYLFNEQENSTS